MKGIVELRPAFRAKEWHEALAGLVADLTSTPRGEPGTSAARRDPLAIPPRKPRLLAAHLGPEPPAAPLSGLATAVGKRPCYDHWDTARRVPEGPLGAPVNPRHPPAEVRR
jgi:hypothetical protein